MSHIIDSDDIQPTMDCTQLFKDSTEQHKYLITSMPTFIIIMGATIILYFPVILMIYHERNKQAVLFKSPTLIMIGGFNLFLDSVCNILINTKFEGMGNSEQTTFICLLSIITTLIFHYIGYFCIVFRAQRIFKVMNLTKTYLTKLYQLGQNSNFRSISNNGSVRPTDNDISIASPLMRRELTESQFEQKIKMTEQKKEKELYSCRENHYLKQMLYIIFAFFLYGVIVILFLDPMFMFMPIYRSDECHYLMIQQQGTQTISKYRLTTNEMVFLFVNWLELAYMYKVWR